jgi:phenylalanyl-tRNA synthetase beta chain
MPVLTIYRDRFKEIIGREVTIEEMHKWLPWLGVDVEEVGKEYIKIEYNPNRPDYGTPVGIGRAYKGLLNEETGLIKYKLRKSNKKIYVDDKVKRVRPFIMGAIVRGISLNDETLKEIIEFQEDLHNGIGRKRKKIAIGLHNLDVIRFPVRYTVVDETFRFIPLEAEEEMTIKEILLYHPKGKEYGHILSKYNIYPIILDDENKVLSFPPIINGIYTEVTTDVKNIFIDVTGLDKETVKNTLNLIVTTLADYGGRIESIEIVEKDNIFTSPILEYRKVYVRPSYVNSLLGLKLSVNEIIRSLEACRISAKHDKEKNIIVCKIPPYRVDILHEIDLVEEVAIGHGLWKLKPTQPTTPTIGKLIDRDKLIDKIIDLMIGYGFQEVINPIMTNPEDQYDKMLVERPSYIEVEEPKSLKYISLRTWILPCLLINLYRSKDTEYPQKIFEIGKTILVEKGIIKEKIKFSVVIAGLDSNYALIKATFDSIMEKLGIREYKIVKSEHPSFIPGRVGEIHIKKKHNIGIIGEIHPQVLENFQLLMPVVAFEITINENLLNIIAYK